MAADDTLILEGARVSSTGTYPAIDLNDGWNLVSILPHTCFYTEGFTHEPANPSDITSYQGYATVELMLKAAFNLSDTDFAKIDSIQIMYSEPYGVRAYDSSVPWFFWSLKFVHPGYGVWIKLKDGQSITLNYQEP